MQQRTFEEVRESLRGKVILVANRSIPARRISRSIRERFEAIAAITATDIDKTEPAAASAQELILLGADPRAYLDLPRIIRLARERGCVAIHPGWGFASEDNNFPKLCTEAGITFIGATAEAMHLLGNKVEARRVARSLGIPVVPGSDESVDVPGARKIVHEIGLPIMLKAEGGGGGRGIRRIDREDQLEEQMSVAKEEAKLFFGNDEVYLEKLIVGPHHVEIQIIADQMGNTVALGERDCSMQRRNQKVLEESPSPLMTPELRKAMQEAAVRAAKACGYYNAGTIEFLVDDDRNFYFMEMNTRIQVEHPVTEWVTGVDLVQTQLLVAQGKPLPFTQDDIQVRGHAIECRINAENPEQGFRPSPGKIRSLHIPGGPGIRVDSAVYQGYTIPPYYDSMIAKLIVHAPTRSQAIMKMRWALAEFIVDGIDSNIDFQLRLIKNKDFEAGTYDNTFLEKFLADSKNGEKENGK